jgi:hypothetical protein
MMFKKSLFIMVTICFVVMGFGITKLLADNGDASISLDPKNPSPNSPVTVTLVSYTFNVNTATITWTSGGKILQKGVGLKKITLQTGTVGQTIPLHITATTADGTTVTLDSNISPESVDLVYEAQENYVPPFYKGKALPGEGSFVKFVALPNMSEGRGKIDPSAISYSWYVNGDFLDDASGIGRQSATIGLEILQNSTIVKVQATAPYGVVAEKEIEVFPHDIMPILYPYDEILGANYSSLVGKRFESTKEFTFLLEPFFLSTKGSLANSVNYLWSLDGLPVTPVDGRLLSLRPKENSYGSKTLSIAISQDKRRLQKGEFASDLVFDTR